MSEKETFRTLCKKVYEGELSLEEAVDYAVENIEPSRPGMSAGVNEWLLDDPDNNLAMLNYYNDGDYDDVTAQAFANAFLDRESGLV